MYCNSRTAKPEEVYQLVTDVHGAYCAEDINRINWFVRTLGSQKVAYIGLLQSQAYLMLYDIGTIKHWRRRGIALALLSHVATVHNATPILASVGTNNHAAIGLFEKAGYDLVKEGNAIRTYLRVPA